MQNKITTMEKKHIEQELINIGWWDSGWYIRKEFKNDIHFFYDTRNSSLIVYKDGNSVLRLLTPTIDRIKALVYGLTGEII